MITKNQNLKFRIKTSTSCFLLSNFFAFLLLSTFYFLLSSGADASQFSTSGDTINVKAGDAAVAEVLLDTAGDDVNAIEANLNYPSDVFDVKTIGTGNSIVSLWLEKPAIAKSGEIKFSGIMPGGYAGRGKLFNVVFLAKADYFGRIEVEHYRILRNDGNGSVSEKSSIFAATAYFDVATTSATSSFAVKDIYPPESFVPDISSNSNIFDGKYFLVFTTTDKGVGVDYFEVMEVSRRKGADLGSWQSAESPYLLKDQTLTSDVYVRAVDMAGNFIIEKIPARFPVAEHDFRIIIIGAIAILIVLLLIIWMVRSRIY